MTPPPRPRYPPGVPPWCRHPFRKREYRCEGCGDPLVWPPLDRCEPPEVEPDADAPD